MMITIALPAALLVPAGHAAATPSNRPVRSCASLIEP
jgi:hypothetical protein